MSLDYLVDLIIALIGLIWLIGAGINALVGLAGLPVTIMILLMFPWMFGFVTCNAIFDSVALILVPNSKKTFRDLGWLGNILAYACGLTEFGLIWKWDGSELAKMGIFLAIPIFFGWLDMWQANKREPSEPRQYSAEEIADQKRANAYFMRFVIPYIVGLVSLIVLARLEQVSPSYWITYIFFFLPSIFLYMLVFPLNK